MEEPEKIVAVLDAFFDGCGSRRLEDRKVLISAGPTRERIDPVRYIGNFSTGKMGYAIARRAAAEGAEVTLVSGPVGISIDDPAVNVVAVESAREMLAACEDAFADADIAIMAAAVADYAPAECAGRKIKREHCDFDEIKLVKNPDIAATLGSRKRPGQILVGFALETDNAAEHAAEKLVRKHLDMIVVNSLADAGAGFGTDTNKISIQYADGRPDGIFDLKSKDEVAADIIDAITRL